MVKDGIWVSNPAGCTERDIRTFMRKERQHRLEVPTYHQTRSQRRRQKDAAAAYRRSRLDAK